MLNNVTAVNASSLPQRRAMAPATRIDPMPLARERSRYGSQDV